MVRYVRRTGQQFAATVGEWTVSMKDRTKLVWQLSIIELVWRMQLPADMGGRMPVRTGFLRASLMVSTSGPVLSLMRHPGSGAWTWDIAEVEALVMAAKLGTPVYIGYGAIYAPHAEYGTRGQPGWGFQRLAVQQWPSIVEQVEAQVRSMV